MFSNGSVDRGREKGNAKRLNFNTILQTISGGVEMFESFIYFSLWCTGITAVCAFLKIATDWDKS